MEAEIEKDKRVKLLEEHLAKVEGDDSLKLEYVVLMQWLWSWSREHTIR